MDNLVGTRFVPTRSLLYSALGFLLYAISGGTAAYLLVFGIVDGEPAFWPILLLLALAAAAASLYWSMRAIVRYMAWDRVRARLGLPAARDPGMKMRDSRRLNWGMMGSDPSRVVAVLDRISNNTNPITVAAQTEVPALARLLRRRFVFDMIVSLVLATPLTFWLIFSLPSTGRLIVPFLALGLQPLSLWLNATRYQDPWLDWYQRHFLAANHPDSSPA